MNVTRNKYHHDMNIWRTVAMTTPTAPILRVPSIARVIRDTLEMGSLVLVCKKYETKLIPFNVLTPDPQPLDNVHY